MNSLKNFLTDRCLEAEVFENRYRYVLNGFMTIGCAVPNGRKIRIEKPVIRNSEEENLWREVHKFAQLIPFEPEPNMGRLGEIKAEIQKGTYLTPEVMEETAARLVIRFMKPE